MLYLSTKNQFASWKNYNICQDCQQYHQHTLISIFISTQVYLSSLVRNMCSLMLGMSRQKPFLIGYLPSFKWQLVIVWEDHNAYIVAQHARLDVCMLLLKVKKARRKALSRTKWFLYCA